MIGPAPLTIPNVTPLALLKVTPDPRLDVAPALQLTFVRSVPELGSESVALPVGAATIARTPAELLIPKVRVLAAELPIPNSSPRRYSVSPLSWTRSWKLPVVSPIFRSLGG
jgi:hypothetical protein